MISTRILAAGRTKIPTLVFASHESASVALAAEIRGWIERAADKGRTAVLGLVAGSTPLALYRELIRLHREEGLSFANVTTFNLDEYYGLPPMHPQSLARFMENYLFNHIDISKANTHAPTGFFARNQREILCRRYEESIAEAGGIDLQILGIGRSGRIGFNEPGAARDSATRRVVLNRITRRDAEREFGGDLYVPHMGMTMGIRTILQARRIVLMACGSHKAEIVARAIEGPVTEMLPASFLQEHLSARCFIDTAAALRLARLELEGAAAGLRREVAA